MLDYRDVPNNSAGLLGMASLGTQECLPELIIIIRGILNNFSKVYIRPLHKSSLFGFGSAHSVPEFLRVI